MFKLIFHLVGCIVVAVVSLILVYEALISVFLNHQAIKISANGNVSQQTTSMCC